MKNLIRLLKIETSHSVCIALVQLFVVADEVCFTNMVNNVHYSIQFLMRCHRSFIVILVHLLKSYCFIRILDSFIPVSGKLR